MNEYLYLLKATRPEMLIESTAGEDAVVGRHFRRLEAAVETGVVILAGRTQNSDPSSFGIVIFRAESDEAARRFMEEDPAVAGGVMTAELFPYRVALMGN